MAYILRSDTTFKYLHYRVHMGASGTVVYPPFEGAA